MIELPPPLNTWNIQPPMADETFRFQRGVISENGQWVPLLTPKGYDVFNDYHRNILLKGCRKSSKTVSCANRFVRHLWEVDGAVGAVCARTMKNGMGGAWNDLVNFVIPGWQAAGVLKVVGQGTDAATKMPYMKISTANGGVSTLQLHSINHEPSVESQFMALRFSIIWFSQAEQFMSADTYRILLMQLRMEMFGIPRDQHHFLFDCNPPDEGDMHWLHDVFEKGKTEGTKYFKPNYHDLFSSYEFGLPDNPLLDPRDKQELMDTYKTDPVKYDRFVLGKWVRDTSEGHFDKTFTFNIHVVGSADSPDRSEWEVLTPPKSTRVLLTGTDTGSLNHATGFWFPYIDERGLVCYGAFDEVCSIDKPISIRAFSTMMWERVQFWTEWMQKTYGHKQPIEWRHWADSSLWNFNSGANCNDAEIFYQVSKGNVNLRSVVKGQGSIRQRIELMNRLFFEDRVRISAHCREAIAWARFLKPGRAKNQPVSQASMQFKHKFDADSYCVGSEIPHELNSQTITPSVAVGVITT